MKLILDKNNEIDYDYIKKSDTVADYIHAVEKFIERYPVNCMDCSDNCCSHGWEIHVDNVFVSQNAEGSLETFMQNNLKLSKIKTNEFCFNDEAACNFLGISGRCTIYTTRPLICRLYVCYPYSPRYRLLSRLITYGFTAAVLWEFFSMQEEEETQKEIFMANPALHVKDYDVAIMSLVEWAEIALRDDDFGLRDDDYKWYRAL